MRALGVIPELAGADDRVLSIAFGPCPEGRHLQGLTEATIRNGIRHAREARHFGRAIYLETYMEARIDRERGAA